MFWTQKGEDIVDPDTGDVLGSLARPKVRKKVISVQPKLAVFWAICKIMLLKKIMRFLSIWVPKDRAKLEEIWQLMLEESNF